MRRGMIMLGVVFWLTGCGGQTLSVRAIQDEPDAFVGVVKGDLEGENQSIAYDHPVKWRERDLYTLLSGLRLQEQGGILDAPRPKRMVFSPDDLRRLVPGLRKAFLSASPLERVVFAIWESSTRSQALEVTSGGLFLQDGRLHVILANHRERVLSEAEGIEAVRDNPLHIVRGIKGALLFEPAMYMVDSQENWPAGGFDSPAREVILDSQAFLASADVPSPGGNAGKGPIDLKPVSQGSSEVPGSMDVRSLREEVSKLKEELSRLKRQLAPQETESLPKDSE